MSWVEAGDGDDGGAVDVSDVDNRESLTQTEADALSEPIPTFRGPMDQGGCKK